MVNRKPYQGRSKRCWLQEICNKYGDFRVARAYKVDGDIRWTKHRTVLECWESEEGLKFLDTVNNRGSFPVEIRIDIDPEEGETPDEIKARFHRVCDRLEKWHYHYGGWFSGSRGYHIHMISYGLMNEPHGMRDKLKEHIIRKCEGEALKVSDHSMMTLEWAKNNKTGEPKVPVRGDSFEWL